MLRINEWLPNPTGKDVGNEWVELGNTGAQAVNISGWVLKNEKGAKTILPNETILPGQFLIIKKPQLKLTLRNSNGGLSLFDSAGQKVDQVNFLGTAPEGKSFGKAGESFSWLVPTPSAENAKPEALVVQALPLNTPIGPSTFSPLPFIIFPILITLVVLYTVKQDALLSKLFFGGHTPDREDEGLVYTLKEEI